jgi:hypothetical protein
MYIKSSRQVRQVILLESATDSTELFALSVTLLAVLLELSDAMTATERELIKNTITTKQLNTFVIDTFFAIFFTPPPLRFYLSLNRQ